MKQIIITFVGLMAVATLAQYVENGFGRKLTATTTPYVLRVNNSTTAYASECSIAVTGSETVYALVNCNTNQFVQTNAVPISPGFPYTFSRDGQQIYNVCLATSNDTSEAVIAFQ